MERAFCNAFCLESIATVGVGVGVGVCGGGSGISGFVNVSYVYH